MFPLLLATLFSSNGAFGEVPKEVTLFVFAFFLFSFVSNPIIQAYFRRELTESFVRLWKKLDLKSFCNTTNISKNETNMESRNM